MFNLLKFVIVSAMVAMATAVATAVAVVVLVAGLAGTTAHLWSTEAVDLVGLVAEHLVPWVIGVKLVNFAWWLRRSHKASKRLDYAVSMAYDSPGLYGVRSGVLDAMNEYDRVFREQAGWLAVNRKTALALLEAEWADARRAIRHIDTRSM